MLPLIPLIPRQFFERLVHFHLANTMHLKERPTNDLASGALAIEEGFGPMVRLLDWKRRMSSYALEVNKSCCLNARFQLARFHLSPLGTIPVMDRAGYKRWRKGIANGFLADSLLDDY